ncbi:MAG: hypothetical protein ACE14L_09860 [Terriglobales bacterium]
MGDWACNRTTPEVELLCLPFTTPGHYVGWFTLLLINAGIAEGKGCSGLAWSKNSPQSDMG